MRYSDDADSSWKGRRPEGIPAENMEIQLTERIEEFASSGSEIEVLEPSVSHKNNNDDDDNDTRPLSGFKGLLQGGGERGMRKEGQGEEEEKERERKGKWTGEGGRGRR